MKKQVLMSMLIVATLTVLSTAVEAQSSRVNWAAKVPFEFTAGGRTFPPGEYSVKVVNPTSDRPALRIQNRETREAAIVHTISETRQRSNVTAVQFRRYGDRYFFAPFALVATRSC